VLSDYNVLGMDFLATLREISTWDSRLPVILVSGSIGDERATELMREGLSDFVLKDRMARLPHAVLAATQKADALRAADLAHRAAERSEQDFHTLFERSPTGIVVVNFVTGLIVDASAKALEMFGYTAEEIRSHTVLDLTHPEDRAKTSGYYARISTGRCEELRVEKRYVRKDGSEFSGEAVISALRDGAGRVVRIIANVLDITARVDAQAKVRLWTEAFEHADLAFAIADAQSNVFLEVNAAFARQRGWSREELIGKPVSSMFPRELADDFMARQRLLDREGHVIAESEHVRRDGTRFPVLLDITTLRDAQGQPSKRVASVLDITERLRAQAELRIAATAFESQEGIIIAGADRVIQRVNRAFSKITGYSAAEAVGRTPKMLQSGRHDRDFYTAMWKTIHDDGVWQGELTSRRRNGELFTERLLISAVHDEKGEVVHYVGTFSDITEEQQAKAQAKHLTYFDVLTELPNRSLLEDRVKHVLAANRRGGELGALLMLDLDHFKKINDSHGHLAGDAVLVEVAQRMRLMIGEGDTLARFSGDKFVVLIEDLEGDPLQAAHRAAALAEKLRSGVSRPFRVAGQEMVCTVSLGATIFRAEGKTVGALLKEAELAMYRAKTKGRNTVCMFEPQMQVELDARNALEADLREAIRLEQFVLHYQIQVDTDGNPVGAEALVRWNHPQRGLVYPDAFIGAAEGSGLIEPIGRWVLDQACEQIVRWAGDAATRNLNLAVNVSALQFKASDFVPAVMQALRRVGTDPAHLKLEITESVVLEDMDDAIAKLRELRQHGIRISLDDFGTGNSSLAYLTRMPIDQLKIDKSFVAKLPDSGNDAMIAQAIIAMGKGLKMEIIAEGVETAEQADFLREQGCDAFQGYYFGRPGPAVRLEVPMAELQALR
jgi:diguanylate cyclase (GGDEF)-like protein/PAS domain S-box-containing protein